MVEVVCDGLVPEVVGDGVVVGFVGTPRTLQVLASQRNQGLSSRAVASHFCQCT